MTKIKIEKIKVRMAPSPTGWLHIGTARTALFNWLFAKHHTGEFIVRVEDTDKERSSKEYENDILKGFEWLGLKWDQLYHQSERTKYYSKYIQKLLDEGRAFWCCHTKDELEAEQKEQMERKKPPRHLCGHKNHESRTMNHENGIIRLKIDTDSDRKIVFEDIIKGRIEFEEKLLGDFSIAKDIDEPLYNFAVVVDDHMMEISHVIRGEDHISNTPKQIKIFEALGWQSPKYAHLPLILGEDRSKMSKRDGAVRLEDYREMGYLPDALVNFLALLGWTPKGDREILTANEIIEQFKIEDIHKSGAVFDVKKLNWINSQYIKLENDENLYLLLTPFVEKYFGQQNKERIIKMSQMFRERLEYLDQIKDFHYFFKQPEYNPELLIWKNGDKKSTKKALSEIRAELINLDFDYDKETFKGILENISGEQFQGDRGAVYWPLRVALSGEKYSADPIEIALLLEKSEILERIGNAIKKL